MAKASGGTTASVQEIYDVVDDSEIPTAVKGPNDLLAETVGQDEPSFNVHTYSDYWLPKPIYFKIATVVHYLTISFEKKVSEIYEFAVDGTIVEYRPEMIDVKHSYMYNQREYSYMDFGDCISVGIPTQRYNWILSEARKATGLEIECSSLTQNGGCTWISAEIKNDPSPVCYVYFRNHDSLVSVGTLRDKVLGLKSNLIGVGHFSRVAVLKTHDDKFVLLFILNKFQLKDRTKKSSKLKAISEVEPPVDIMDSLMIPKPKPNSSCGFVIFITVFIIPYVFLPLLLFILRKLAQLNDSLPE